MPTAPSASPSAIKPSSGKPMKAVRRPSRGSIKPSSGKPMKAVLLLSGGIDSPVAGRMLRQQGVELVALHASLEPVTDDASVHKAQALAARLGLERLWVARIGEAMGRIPHDRDAHRHYFVLQKRMLYRLADALADQVGAEVIATGENLGQVSSQTLLNLRTIEAAARRPVLRPLLGLDKVEIVDLAKRYDTFETSVGPELCDLLGPDHPATQSRVADVEAMEDRVRLADGLPDIEAIDLEATASA